MTFRQMVARVNTQIGSQRYRTEIEEGSWQFGFRGYGAHGGLTPGKARAVNADYCKRSYYCYVGGEPQLQDLHGVDSGLKLPEDEAWKLFEESGASQFKTWKQETMQKLIAYVKENEPDWAR